LAGESALLGQHDRENRIMATKNHEAATGEDRYGDEVLNASWLPQEVLGANPGSRSEDISEVSTRQADTDPDEFLRRLYSAQE
jgi:hypothetical protein